MMTSSSGLLVTLLAAFLGLPGSAAAQDYAGHHPDASASGELRGGGRRRLRVPRVPRAGRQRTCNRTAHAGRPHPGERGDRNGGGGGGVRIPPPLRRHGRFHPMSGRTGTYRPGCSRNFLAQRSEQKWYVLPWKSTVATASRLSISIPQTSSWTFMTPPAHWLIPFDSTITTEYRTIRVKLR